MQDYANYQFEIIWITQPGHLQQYAQLIDEFFTLYEDPSNFPDPDEREEPSFIKGRIAEGTNNPHTHLMAYLLISPSGEQYFIAGCVVEFYPDSACALVTYLFVNQNFRGVKIGAQEQKVAESMLQSQLGLVGLVAFFTQQYKKPVKAVLFESNNPAQTVAENDSMPPIKRIQFFARLGARRINFEYIQPPLGDDKGIVTNLFLLTFPWLTQMGESIPVTVVMEFVMELAKSLDRNKEPGSATCYGDENYYRDLAALAELGGVKQLDTVNPELIGIDVDGCNIIRTMYNNLVAQRVDEKNVDLISPL
ncbi:hypothetical protein [Fibrella forsythiae]|uniref:N-acetyltransferase domain-containing protein n=1 Tax=Fibrella forsythiae TaxID=2817061 RepID=A0ABS3JGS8_9BACT|nr:hypothetical protein [Fibrella forsythiae]MBO0949203.1 hypothetical protein [Fibrella forsythiae]